MGTHPIFESDFDCLTDLIRTTIHNGPYLSHRRRRLQVLALSDVLQACPAQAHQDGDQGREEGQRRRCREGGRWRQERWCPPGHFRQAAQVLPNSFGPPQDQGSRPEALLPARPLIALVNHARYRLDPSRRCPPWQARCFLEATRVWSSPRHWPIQGQRHPTPPLHFLGRRRHLHQVGRVRSRHSRQRQRRLLQARRRRQEDRGGHLREEGREVHRFRAAQGRPKGRRCRSLEGHWRRCLHEGLLAEGVRSLPPPVPSLDEILNISCFFCLFRYFTNKTLITARKQK